MEFAFLYLWPDSHPRNLAGRHPHQSGACAAVPDYFAAGDCRGVFLAGRLLRRCAGNHRLRRGHYGAVRLRGDDAQPGRHRDRTGAQVAAAGGSGLARPSLSAVLLVVIVYAILGINDQGIDGAAINAKEVGIALFGPYVLAVELASMLLLAGLVVAFHIGREERAGEVLSNRLNDSDKRKRRNTHDPLTHGLILAAILFVLGLTGLVIRRNLLFMLISLEIMINAAALAFVVAGSYWGQADGQIMYILAISLAAAEASIGLALLLQLHRRRQNLNIDSVSELRG